MVQTAAFQSQKSLESLDLSHNLLVALEARSLAGLSHLRYLYLAHNRLTRFNSDVFHGEQTKLCSLFRALWMW
jgi:Leucine-rich repeat (LRR) protein